MGKLYVTKQGDMWDSVAYTQLGDTAHTDKLMIHNASLLGYYIFPAGITLVLPDVSVETSNSLPPWKQVAG